LTFAIHNVRCETLTLGSVTIPVSSHLRSRAHLKNENGRRVAPVKASRKSISHHSQSVSAIVFIATEPALRGRGGLAARR
jgi:hypothetical protein